MLRSIRLRGSLGEKFGIEPIILDVDSPTMLIRGLCCVVDGFETEFRKNTHFQLVRVDTKKQVVQHVTEESFRMPFSEDDELHLMPTVEGSGFELAAMLFVKGTMAYVIAGIVINIALSMAFSAIASALASTPSSSSSAKADEKPSTIFSRAINVSAPGYPVPLVFGECLTGSVVVSVGVQTEQVL